MLYYFKEHKYNKLVKQYIRKQTAYHFERILGSGAYGVAYLLQHKFSKERYVLKRLKTKHLQNSQTIKKFEQEILFLQKLASPHFPTVIDKGELRSAPFYIMDYIDGFTFEHTIFQEGTTFSLLESLHIVSQLLEIIIPMHAEGIVHRDLRIPNILLKDGQLQIIDFGLATYIRDDVILETIENPKRAENHLSDLYSIGHFLLYLLYSSYTPTGRKNLSWQQELMLPHDLVDFIERLLLTHDAFTSAAHAQESLQQIIQEQRHKCPL